jgi:Sel1 repeat
MLIMLLQFPPAYLKRFGIGNAIRIIRPLAEQGDAKAQSYLGYLLEVGGNRAEAKEWYHRAADQGDPSGEQMAGYDYRDRHDYIRAYMWFSLAAKFVGRYCTLPNVTTTCLDDISETASENRPCRQ